MKFEGTKSLGLLDQQVIVVYYLHRVKGGSHGRETGKLFRKF